MNIEISRNIIEWGSNGKSHNEPTTMRKIKDISDSHLSNIICWINNNMEHYTTEILKLMEDEVMFRTENDITVKDYSSLSTFKFKFLK